MPGKRKKARCSPIQRAWKFFYRGLVICSALIVALFCAYKLAAKPPTMAADAVPPAQGAADAETLAQEDSAWTRKPYTYTILLVASDQESGNADTIMVCTYDTVNQKVGLVSIPRDTMVDRTTPKINSVYHNGPEEMAAVVSDMLGIPIDYYIAADMTGFAKLVDAVGGIDFDVPVYMSYDDPVQDLHIHYSAGMQHLTGAQVLEVARCRKNYDSKGNLYDAYPDADIGRTRTQQALLTAIVKKALSNPQKAGSYLSILTEYVRTDFSTGELLWFLEPALGLDFSTGISTETLPGDGSVRYRGTSWCYELYPEECLAIINDLLNPYTQDITLDRTNMAQAS
ncbi:MAG: LCP family protein [Oscillospiraceae bacterium]|nr:LCP family protein [Oscillospiraceae bacterium]